MAKIAQTTDPIEAELTEEDINRMIAQQVIELTSYDEARGWCRVFTVTEVEKHRRRLISEPMLNYADYDPGSVHLATAQDILNGVGHHKAMIHDFPWFYGQMPIPLEARSFYCFAWRGNIYRLCTVPTGSRWTPEFAQAITSSIVTRATGKIPNDAKPGEKPNECFIHTDTYIDDARVCTTDDDIELLTQNFLHTCEKATVDVGQTPPIIATEYDFLGVACSHTDGSVALTAKTLGKISRWANVIATATPITFRQALSMLGLFIFASSILHIHTAPYYYCLKFIRRRAAATWNLDADAKLWPCAAEKFTQWSNDLVKNIPYKPTLPQQNHPTTIITDASMTGYGLSGLIHNESQK